MSNGNNSTKNILQRLYNCRLKIDRNGKTILNFSSLFSLACLIFAPHMTIAGLVLSLVLGYHINLENENSDERLEDTFRQAAETVRKTATVAARTIRDEVEKVNHSREEKGSGQFPAGADREQIEDGVSPEENSANMREIVEDLEKETVRDLEDNAFHGNPAVYHSAYSAVAGSVPTLKVEEAPAYTEPDPQKHMNI